MKRISLAFMCILVVTACKKDASDVEQLSQTMKPATKASKHSSIIRYSGPDYSQPISINHANELIGSYLSSINHASNDTDLRSLTFDADTLRSYLSNDQIVTLKFFLAHQPSYIANGNYGINAGLNSRAVTLVVVGVDESGKYIYNEHNQVYEHFMPCPSNCVGNTVITNY